ncbi:TPA: hypothetical protein ACL7D4_004011 [Klebsiella pneumoniae]
MEIVIPVAMIFLVVFQVVSYARVVFLRRHLMKPLVERYLLRQDASNIQKRLAVEAFKDALSISLPIKLLIGHKAREREQAGNVLKNKEDSAFMAHCMQENPANEALAELISLMFSLNVKFNIVLHFVCLLFRVKWRSLTDFREVRNSVGNAYVDLKHQHS